MKSRASPLPQVGTEALATRSVARIIQARAKAAGFGIEAFGEHSLKRGAMTTGMDLGQHPTKLKPLGQHKSYSQPDEYLDVSGRFNRRR